MAANELPIAITQEFQVSITSAQLNSTIVFTFLSGIYSMVYAGTMYFNIFKVPKQSRNIIVLSTISLLYALCIVQLGFQWYFVNFIFIQNGDTRLSMFLAVFERASAGQTSSVFLTTFCLMFIISDALLIWRCYHVWGRSLRVIVLPLIFILAETGLSIAVVVLSFNLSQAATAINTFKNITGPQAFVSFGTTSLCTILIGYKIHFSTNAVTTHKATRSSLRHIIKILVESAAIYSLTLLAYAVQTTIPISVDSLLQSPLLVEGYYFQPITVSIAGLAPTIIAARIALSKNDEVHSNPTLPSVYLGTMSIESRLRTAAVNQNSSCP